MTDVDDGPTPRGGPLEARRVGFALARYRERYRVALDALAEWSTIPVDRLMSFEGGHALPTHEELEHVVNAFARAGDSSLVNVRTMHVELLRLGGYPPPRVHPRRGAPYSAYQLGTRSR